MIIRKAKLSDIPFVVELAIKLMKHHTKIDNYFDLAHDAQITYTKYFNSCIRSSKKIILVAEENKKSSDTFWETFLIVHQYIK